MYNNTRCDPLHLRPLRTKIFLRVATYKIEKILPNLLLPPALKINLVTPPFQESGLPATKLDCVVQGFFETPLNAQFLQNTGTIFKSKTKIQRPCMAFFMPICLVLLSQQEQQQVAALLDLGVSLQVKIVR